MYTISRFFKIAPRAQQAIMARQRCYTDLNAATNATIKTDYQRCDLTGFIINTPPVAITSDLPKGSDKTSPARESSDDLGPHI